MKTKAVSPVIATVLLIAIVVVIALIVFLWFRGIGQETVTKFGGKNIEVVCDEVSFEAGYLEGDLYISNLGNVPIYSFELASYWDGGHEKKEINESVLDWPELGLNQGGTYFGTIATPDSSTYQIVLTPILRGSSDAGERTHKCNENQHGFVIIIP